LSPIAHSKELTISQDDLAAFHAHHFDGRQLGFPGTPISATAPESSSLREGHYEDGDLEYDDDDDGLGYYPDGVKRTLTDAQIAIFRWSEVQSLLRAKRRRLGELEEEGLDEGSAESKKQRVERECSSRDASDAKQGTRTSGKRKERTAYTSVGTEATLRSKKWKRAKLRASYDGGTPVGKDLHVTTDRENILNYDEVPDSQNQAFPEDVLVDESEDEGEYERFLAKEREEFDGTSSSERETDTRVERGGPDMVGGTLSSLGHGNTDADGKELVQQSTSTTSTLPRVACVNNMPSTPPTLIPRGSNNGIVPSGNTAGGTTQPMHSRRRIFYGDDDDGDEVGDAHRPPTSACHTVAVAAGGVTKGEKRAFLWPKIGGS
jgi:hypothetical protein